MVNKDFCKQVLSGQKKLLKMSQMTPVNVPSYDEVSVKRLYADALKLQEMEFYFPDEYPKGRQADRTYFFNIFNSLHPETMANVLKHANEKRYGEEADNMREEAIAMTEEFAN